MSGTRLAPQPGPELTARELADRLLLVSGVFAAHRDTGCLLKPVDVVRMMAILDTGAADATRIANEIGELTDMIYDLAEPEPARPKKGPPALRIIQGTGRC